jgi:hypothetical protein
MELGNDGICGPKRGRSDVEWKLVEPLKKIYPPLTGNIV